MVNHFATLLCNLNLSSTTEERDEYLLAGNSSSDEGFLLVTQGGYYLYLDGSVEEQTVKSYSALTNKDYSSIELPPELEDFYNILFAEAGAKYYQQFLLYCYLRIVAATNLKEHVKDYDSRITYNLEEFSEYFRCPRLSPTSTSDERFKLLVHGSMDTGEHTRDFANHIVVSQINNTSSISIYSATQMEYYKPGTFSSKRLEGMIIDLSEFYDQPSSRVTKPIALSDTGLTISLTGPLDDFSATANKTWSFSAESPFVFDFPSKLALIKNSERKVDSMLNYKKDSTRVVFEHIWRSHPNSVYALAALLIAYVERVNIVWETRLT